MKNITFIIIAVISLFLMAGCGQGSKVAGPCNSGFNIQFKITSVKEGLPLDSLDLSIKVGETGTPQKFAVNLKTGESSANITAVQGQKYELDFLLFSAGHEIGKGTQTGTLNCGLDVELSPVWNTAETEKAKTQLSSGTLLPAKLSVYFTQAIAGKKFDLPLDSLTQGSYRWYVKNASGDSINLANANLFEGEGPRVSFLIPDSLAGKKITMRLQVFVEGIIKEERIWMITVLAAPSMDRLSRITIRVDSSDKQGASQVLNYSSGRLSLIQYFDTLTPAKDQKPNGLDSLYYDDKGRLIQKISFLSDSSRIDSVFTYNAEGKLSLLEYRKGKDIVIDSLIYVNGRLAADFRIVAGKVVERTQFVWTGTEKRVDSVFSVDVDGDKCRGYVETTYKNDSLIERKISGVQGGLLQAKSTEVIAYNALGLRAYREIYTASGSLSLDRTEVYSYDIKGRQISLRIKDEVTGYNLHFYQYEYSAVAAAKVTATWAVNKSAANSLALTAVLSDIRAAHSSLDFELTQRAQQQGLK